MPNSELALELMCAFPELNISFDEPMSAHSSFRIGGPADIFIRPSSGEELRELMRYFRKTAVPVVIIGNGTNILVRDEGVRGVVIKIGEGLSGLSLEGNTITAESGVSMARLACFARDNGLGGLEFAHGIPGSLGGAVMMNAGAYGGEMKEVVSSVRYLDSDGEIKECSDCGFSYRRSMFTDTARVILSARLCLRPADKEAVSARMAELWEKRSGSQPLDKPSAGSTFKRPENGYAAAMIEGAGLKGFSIGGAQVSEKHAGFVINAGGATFEDVRALMEHIRKTVFQKYGTMLEPEVRILG